MFFQWFPRFPWISENNVFIYCKWLDDAWSHLCLQNSVCALTARHSSARHCLQWRSRLFSDHVKRTINTCANVGHSHSPFAGVIWAARGCFMCLYGRAVHYKLPRISALEQLPFNAHTNEVRVGQVCFCIVIHDYFLIHELFGGGAVYRNNINLQCCTYAYLFSF